MWGLGGRRRNQEIIINNGNGTTIIEEKRGLFGRRKEEIIINNRGRGMGNTTVIQERGGFFGPREQIIMNNGMGRGGTTIIEEGGFFGPREQIIVNNNGWGGGTTIIEEGGGMFGPREEIIVNNGWGGGGTTIIEERGGMFGPREQIIVNNNGWGGGTTIIEQGGGFFGPREEIIINNGGNGYNQNRNMRNQQYRNQQYQNQYQNQQYQNQQYPNQQYPNQQYPNQQNRPNQWNSQQQSNQNTQNQWGGQQQQQQQRPQPQVNKQQQNLQAQVNKKQSQQKQQQQQRQKNQQEQQKQNNQQPDSTVQQQYQQQVQIPVQAKPVQPEQKIIEKNVMIQKQQVQEVKQEKIVKQSVPADSISKISMTTASNNSRVQYPTVQPPKQQKPAPKKQQAPKQAPSQQKPINQLPTYPQICAFAYHFNRTMKSDPNMKAYVPMNPNTFFNKLQDGVVFCKFINFACSQGESNIPVISPLAINMNPKTEREAIENLNMAIDSAKSLGCYMTGIKPNLLLQKNQNTVLSFVWEIVLIHISNSICFRRYPEIILLKNEDQDEDIFRKIGYKNIFIRWLNYHYKLRGQTNRTIANLGADLADSDAYGMLLSNTCALDSTFWQKNKAQRAKIVINTCVKNKVDTPIHSSDITSGKSHLNTILCYDIFTKFNGLDVQIPESIKPEPQTLKNREIQMFGNWINSLGLKGISINDLISDLKTGKVLLSIIQKIHPGSVNWQKNFSTKFNSRIHIIHNCNYAVQLCTQKLGLKLVNIQGVDIVDGKVNLILGLVWQLCNVYWEKRVGKIVNRELIAWANSKVEQKYKISSLDDKSLSSGIYLLQVTQGVKPKTVDFSLLKNTNTEENRINNINYCLSCMRKLGAEILALWEHIYEVDSRFIALILAELRRIDQNKP